MPAVPTYDNLRASTAAPAAPYFDVPNASPASIAGRQLQAMGEHLAGAGQDVVRIAADARERFDAQVVRELDTTATEKISALLFDPEQGFMAKQAGAPRAAFEDYGAKLRQLHSDIVAQAPDDRSRKQVAATVGDRVTAALAAMGRHTIAETQKFEFSSSDARAKVSLQAAAQDYANGDAFAGNLGVALIEAEKQGQMQGWTADQVKLQQQAYTDQAFKLRYDAWRTQDPVGALADFQRNAQAISPVARVALYHQLFEAAAPSLAQQVNAAGGVGVVQPEPAAGKAAAPAGPLPRGIRNNNPGNIMRTPSTWQGEVQGTDPVYASFETPEAGIRAMGKTLLTYADQHGLQTVGDIIARWAPATSNDTAAYAGAVAKALKVAPGDPIDVHDPKTMTALVKAMILQENGRQPYTDQQIALGLSAATGTPLPATSAPPGAAPTPAATAAADAWRNPAVSTGNPVIDALPADWKLHVLQAARAQSERDMHAARDALRSKVQDAATSYMVNGWAPNAPALAEFIQAYGQGEGQAQFAQFQGIARLGQQLQQVKTLPDASLVQLVQQSKPVPGPGFDAAQRNFATLADAVDKVRKARQEDPIRYALVTGEQPKRGPDGAPDPTAPPPVGAYGLRPLNLNDPNLSTQIRQRSNVALQIAQDYGTAPTLLSKDEAKALTAAIQAAPVEKQKQYLAAIAMGAGSQQMVQATMQAIAPDQPVLALAGIYQARGLRSTFERDVADLLLRGQAILTPNTKTDGTGHEGGRSLIKMPDAKLMLSDFNGITRDAFAGKEQAADLFMQGARAIYAAKAAEAGDYSGNYDADRWRQSVNLATGGLQQHNGRTVVMPYGLPYDVFQTRLAAFAPDLAAQALNASADELRRLPLENLGDGVYLFKRGAGYVVTKDGRPLTVNLNTMPTAGTSAK